LVANSEDQAQEWLRNVGIDIDTDSTVDSLYLPFPRPFQLPNTKLDLYNIVRQGGEPYLKSLENYFNTKRPNQYIFFSFPLRGEEILSGWKQTIPRSISGFRPGKAPLQIRFQHSNIDKIQVYRVDKERLFRRGGIGIIPSIREKSLAIIGCGSLGGSLTVTLSKTGISNFLLVDNELLEEENVARHECGFMEAGNRLAKSLAIKNRITSHLPHIHCKYYYEDILTVLRNEPTLLNSYDIAIVAIGKMAVERRLNSLLRQGPITAPLLFVWLEPFGVAGHMLYIHPNIGGCYQCCHKDGGFRFSVAKPSQNFNKKESGCQSTFVEYSNLDMQHFMIIVSRTIVKVLQERPESSILYTWLGDLEFFKSLGYEICDEWVADSSFSVHKRIIQRNDECKLCKNQ
jgi:molybdopterin/thiamine biosynthesis adenylyltransferase